MRAGSKLEGASVSRTDSVKFPDGMIQTSAQMGIADLWAMDASYTQVPINVNRRASLSPFQVVRQSRS